MYITIINDCNDPNAVGRQSTRVASLFGVTPSFIGIAGSLDAAGELEAAGNLIDCLDASGGTKGCILVNVAPRSGAGKRWQNGTPFGYFRYRDTVVLASIAGLTLSLAKKVGLIQELSVFDLEGTVEAAERQGFIARGEAARIALSQFRSFDFLPRAAHWIASGGPVISAPLSISDIPDASRSIWAVDNFGNCKTTLLAEEVAVGDTVETRWGPLTLYSRLKDVPDRILALVIGSSGIENRRFVEIVLQGGSASNLLGARQGDLVGA